MLSDERMKENIKRVGKLDNDLNVYQFKYKGLPETHIGLIAQEVERKRPEAIVESGGLKYVRYDLATLLEAA